MPDGVFDEFQEGARDAGVGEREREKELTYVCMYVLCTSCHDSGKDPDTHPYRMVCIETALASTIIGPDSTLVARSTLSIRTAGR